MNNKLMKDDPVEVMDEKAALKENLVKHVLDQLPNALQAALPALNAYPNDPGVLLLTVTAALIDRNPDQALRFLHRFTKNWQSREYEDQLLRAIALAQQGHWLQAAMIGKQIGWPNLFGAFIHLPGSWALRDWAHGWVRQIERYEDRQKRSVAAKKGLERRKAGVAKSERAAKPHREEKAREPQVEETVPAEAAPETAPSAEPELSALPRYQIRIPFSVEFSDSLESSLALRSSSNEADREAFRLRHELAHLRLLQGFDELLCLPTLRGVETYWYQLETVRKALKQFRGRVLLADEVGLGKTIEAGMVLKEYLLRGMAERVLVLTPDAGRPVARGDGGQVRDRVCDQLRFAAQERSRKVLVAAARHLFNRFGAPRRTSGDSGQTELRHRDRRRGAPSEEPRDRELEDGQRSQQTLSAAALGDSRSELACRALQPADAS